MEHCAGEAGERVKDITSPMEQLPVLRVNVVGRKGKFRGGLTMGLLLSFCVPL